MRMFLVAVAALLIFAWAKQNENCPQEVTMQIEVSDFIASMVTQSEDEDSIVIKLNSANQGPLSVKVTDKNTGDAILSDDCQDVEWTVFGYECEKCNTLEYIKLDSTKTPNMLIFDKKYVEQATDGF